MSRFEQEERARNLVQQLRGEDATGRSRAAVQLSEMGQGCRAVLPDLIGSLQHHDAGVRTVAAWVLGYVGVGSAEAARALHRAQSDGDLSVRRAARAALTVAALGRAA